MKNLSSDKPSGSSCVVNEDIGRASVLRARDSVRI